NSNDNRIQDSLSNICIDTNTKPSIQQNMLKDNFLTKDINDENTNLELCHTVNLK
ncbi:2550_t:CDS:1, partial [Scutellospora calospora]